MKLLNLVFRYPRRVFALLCFSAIAAIAAAGALCALTTRSRAAESEARMRALRAERSRDCVMMLSGELQKFIAGADAVPADDYRKLSSEFMADIQDYATMAFWFCTYTDALKKSYGLCALNGLDNGYFKDTERYVKDAEKLFTYAELRVGANQISWMETYARYYNGLRIVDDVHWRTPLTLKNWTWTQDIYGEGKADFASAGGFRFDVFQDRLFLVRTLRAEGAAKYVQGFLLNEEKLIFILLTKVRCTLPGASLEFCPNAADADIAPCGLPLKFSAGTLREEIAARAELNAFRFMLAGTWIGGALLCAGALAAFRFLQSSAERRRVFVASVVHDLRSPVAGISALADAMSEKSAGTGDSSRDLKMLVGRVRDLSALLDNTLLFSRIADSKRDVLKFRDVVFGEAVAPIFDRMTERLDRAGCDFDTNISADAENARLRISSAALERILFNLADNAAKYASGGNAPVLTLTAELSGSKKLLVRVADSGNGISARAKKNLFREFSRSAQEATDTGVHGLGIGLALSKKLARILGGDLTLEKSDSSGTVFLLTLPVK